MNYDEICRLSKAVYLSDGKKDKTKNCIVFSHCLDTGGAPLVLLEMLELLKDEYNISLISPFDGELADAFVKRGIDVYIGNVRDFAPAGSEFWKQFDLAILNTLLAYPFAACFQNTSVPTIWWLHESMPTFEDAYKLAIPFGLLSKNIKIVSVTAYTADCVKKMYGLDSEIMPMGLCDRYTENTEDEDGIVRFYMPASFEGRKAQDIMVQAIVSLPREYLSRTEFFFSGPVINKAYSDVVTKLTEAYPNVHMLGQLTKEEVYGVYQQIDCVVAPSRADPTPTTIVEGMMFKRLSLCSDATGISKYITDFESGYVFPSGNADSLKDKIMYIVDHRDEWERVQNAGREIFLKYFEKTRMQEKLYQLIK